MPKFSFHQLRQNSSEGKADAFGMSSNATLGEMG